MILESDLNVVKGENQISPLWPKGTLLPHRLAESAFSQSYAANTHTYSDSGNTLISTLTRVSRHERACVLSLPFCHVGTVRRWLPMNKKVGPSQIPNIPETWSWTTNTLLLFISHPFYGILLQQPKQTKTACNCHFQEAMTLVHHLYPGPSAGT